jgi:hypothetical protein
MYIFDDLNIGTSNSNNDVNDNVVVEAIWMIEENREGIRPRSTRLELMLT